LSSLTNTTNFKKLGSNKD